MVGVLGGALAVAASASFDMALVTDAGTNSVHRIDPINNVYLGAFGGGILSNPRGVVVNQLLNRAYVLDSASRISVWNYNTGAFLTSFSVNIIGAKLLTGNSDGTLNVTGTAVVSRLSATGTPLTTYVRSGTLDTQQAILMNDGFFYLSTRNTTNQSLERFNYATGAFLGASNWLADRIAPIPAVGGANAFNAYAIGSDVLLELNFMNGGPTFVDSDFTPLIDRVAGIASGHGGMTFVVGRDRTTPTRGGILRVDANSLTAGPTLAGTAQIVNPTGIATVVAPEPATMLALGGGFALLLRRRRRQ